MKSAIKLAHYRLAVTLCATLSLTAAALFAAPDINPFRTMPNPGGGTIAYGPLGSQLTPQNAVELALRQVHDTFGDRPRVGSVAKRLGGSLLAAFFTVNAKKQDGKQMTGMLIVYAPQTGSAGAAVLSDYSERFPSTANSMFKLLVQDLGTPKGSSGQPAGPPLAAPPKPLQPVYFPDRSGVIGLPAGWNMTRAQLGDVTVNGPNGEVLRFGLTIALQDGRGSRQFKGRGRAPGGNFLLVPFSNDPIATYKAIAEQAAQKTRTQAPTVDIDNVREISMQGGSNHFLYGSIDKHDGKDAQMLIVQMLATAPQAMGTWQATLFQIVGPKQAMIDERATLSAIFPNYSRNSRYVNAVVNTQIVQGIENTKAFVGEVARHVDDSNRMAQGMSDYLREDTVLRDTRTGAHIRRADDYAEGLMEANPGRYEKVSLSDYISGIDY